MAQYGFGTEAAAKDLGQTTGPGPTGTSSNPSTPGASTTKKSGVATKEAEAAVGKGSITLDTTKASTSVMKGVGVPIREKSAAQKLAQDLFPEDAQIIGGHAQTAGKKRKASSSAPDRAARGKRARTSDLPCEDVVNVWLARLRSLTKGKRVLNRAELRAVSDALEELREYDLPFAFVEESGLLAAVDQVVQMTPADIPGGDEHKLCRRAEALFESWIV
ncbi:hypothetical protein K525DRAFT_269133 [Schizophyllum commune Loenen D]|nr:hypothetical protein K525DRAFT_269133 [Schizophyllum commune Loenen D]